MVLDVIDINPDVIQSKVGVRTEPVETVCRSRVYTETKTFGATIVL